MAEVTRTSIALLIAASFCATVPSAFAQDLPPLSTDQPTGGSVKAPHVKNIHKKKSAPAAPAAAQASSEAAERAAALARGRKKFFENKPDQQSDPSGSDIPVHLGGSNGLSPQMGFKF
jgi:hypothetical protein